MLGRSAVNPGTEQKAAECEGLVSNSYTSHEESRSVFRRSVGRRDGGKESGLTLPQRNMGGPDPVGDS